MPKQEHKILTFHGGKNDKFDPRDIEDNQNVGGQMSIRYPGRLVVEGNFKSLYLSGKAINDINAGDGAFQAGNGLYIFSNDYDMDATPDEVETEFIVLNDQADIDIYDPNKSGAAGWREAEFTLGSRTGTVKPHYYNIDGALRVSDTNFGTTYSTETTSGTPAPQTLKSNNKNDTTLTTTSGTIPTGSIIKINKEILYVTSGSSGGTEITVIRGFANTKTQDHAGGSTINYVNIPRYFGHIGGTDFNRLEQCKFSDLVNVWARDVLTPQPPNNTRTGQLTATAVAGSYLANSAGIQSLRVYDTLEASTVGFPAESEKVTLEFGVAQPDFGIIKVDVSATATNNITITTSGNGSDASGNHGLAVGDEIVIDNLNSTVQGLAGTHEVAAVSATTFDINIESYSGDLDATPSGDETYSATVDSSGGFADIGSDAGASFPGNVQVNIDETDMPAMQADGSFWVHITGQTGVPAFNGVHYATRISGDNNSLRFKNASHGDAGDFAGATEVQQLLGTVVKVAGKALDSSLKRKWNFAMSFTYDGPPLASQESLLTAGYKITPVTQTSGAACLIAEGAQYNAGDTTLTTDEGDVFSVGDILLIESEQLYVSAVNTSNEQLTVTRGYNKTTDANHADDTQIYKVEELTPTATVDWTSFNFAPKCVIKFLYNHAGHATAQWNPRINGFKIYMKDVTDGDASEEWRLFSKVDLDKGTYQILAADESDLVLEQPGNWTADYKVSTLSTGTTINSKPINTYLTENLFTDDTRIDAQFKTSALIGRTLYIGNIKQGGKTFPDKMIRTPVNKFDTFPESNFLDVAVGDGDEIVKLVSYGDRLLQFKKNKLYILNASGEKELLEAEYNDLGVSYPTQVVKTNDGVCWFNRGGLYLFNGEGIQNLSEHTRGSEWNVQKSSDPITNVSLIGFDRVTNRIVFSQDVLASIGSEFYIYDLTLKAYQGPYTALFPYDTSLNYYTNMVNNSDGDLIVGWTNTEAAVDELVKFYKWDNSPVGDTNGFGGEISLWESKDIDFGSPSIRKKIYKVYVTYKCTGLSGVKVYYKTDGSGSYTEFSDTKSNFYYTYNNLAAQYQGQLQDTSGAWKVAELKPDSSINNIKSIQLKFSSGVGGVVGNCNGTGDSTHIVLASGASDADNYYNNMNIAITSGPGAFNVKKITDYVGSSRTVEVGTMTDYGYTNIPTTDSNYYIGAVPSDFEINDITIVYRAKRVK